MNDKTHCHNYPTDAFAEDFEAQGLGAGDPVWTMERQSGAAAQTVIQEFAVEDDLDAPCFTRYSLQIACYHTNRHEARRRAMAVYCYYRQFRGRYSGVPGYTFANWHAEQVRCQLVGVNDAIEITGTLLYKAVVNIMLVVVSRKGDE